MRLLGNLLGDTLKQQVGQALFEKVEQIRHLAKQTRDGNEQAKIQLDQVLSNLSEQELLPVARAFTQFLNFANIAEQYHRVRRRRDWQSREDAPAQAGSLQELIPRLLAANCTPDQLWQAALDLNVELVLTAHPTEISRRTLIQKYDDITECLQILDQQRLTMQEKQAVLERLKRQIIAAWHTDEIRSHKPTPVDEAKWGFTAIEQTLWFTIPQFMRELDAVIFQHTGQHLPLTHAPVRFASWMGGDRDGNPNVTHQVTQEVLLLSRWQAADLYWRDVDALRWDLSMEDCNAALREVVGEQSREPYRDILRTVRNRLEHTRNWLHAQIRGAGQRVDQGVNSGFSSAMSNSAPADNSAVYHDTDELLQPLLLCYDSLVDCNMQDVANGELLDLIRRVSCFGIELLKLDVRQESGRHREALNAITEYLKLGSYLEWDEAQRQQFLLQELNNPRPLLPHDLHVDQSHSGWSDNVQEVMATFDMLARQPHQSLGAYVISMAEYPSDVLAVMLLQKEAEIARPMRVVPLFETLKDLNNAASSLQQLLEIDWYKQAITSSDGQARQEAKQQAKQEIMIGYSDSAKDAGFLAANWAQYRAQEQLMQVAEQHGVQLTLFHGRGGSISRGGAPTYQALLSQPPGSVKGKIRVTEQGEMIRFKFGMQGIALRNLELYASATLEATLLPPPAAKPEWRALMDSMTKVSVATYRQTVRENPLFIQYLRTVTPELELQMLPLGSRPARRKVSGGIESLRAIPWVFAWTQVRLMLPAWLGTGRALRTALAEGQRCTIEDMNQHWPYFQTLLDMLEMVLVKADPAIAAYYESRLTQDPQLIELGKELRRRLDSATQTLLEVIDQPALLQHESVLKRSINVRTPYILPLHLLQAELMQRRREHDDNTFDHALMVTIAGIAAGLRNTG
ncbi:phosphoenolpyruvate carboxylase [Alkanindiges hydrocarboniclasticus]|uniref:Phosphoenolpyruvate carboxylase n=1 Tax=Alkanindiges hydrocarboniclasticus TaxID=1907941 RepID=A0A1S8CX08_9GAMM|nr:phosphoenolpyruvate carboxylase [Alkanindiges hydrocarboniclasticus]